MANTPEPIYPTRVYTAVQAAQVMQVDKSVVYKAVEGGELPENIKGRGLKFLGEDLLRYMGSQTYQGQPVDHGGSGEMGANQGDQPF